jgi:hypothetical protein
MREGPSRYSQKASSSVTSRVPARPTRPPDEASPGPDFIAETGVRGGADFPARLAVGVTARRVITIRACSDISDDPIGLLAGDPSFYAHGVGRWTIKSSLGLLCDGLLP